MECSALGMTVLRRIGFGRGGADDIPSEFWNIAREIVGLSPGIFKSFFGHFLPIRVILAGIRQHFRVFGQYLCSKCKISIKISPFSLKVSQILPEYLQTSWLNFGSRKKLGGQSGMFPPPLPLRPARVDRPGVCHEIEWLKGNIDDKYWETTRGSATGRGSREEAYPRKKFYCRHRLLPWGRNGKKKKKKVIRNRRTCTGRMRGRA